LNRDEERRAVPECSTFASIDVGSLAITREAQDPGA
jgi:hypothetical protein